jgi:2-keto-4-pentenoate hydratase/2-oxohepta-3-ene-1,7-dioic acid hydratase in catechol pathway
MKIICIGRNYAEHAKELNNPLPKVPVFFLKPDTALIKNNGDFYLPDHSHDVHHEVEVVLRISKAGKHIQPEFAHKYWDAITVGIDFTARDVQQSLKEKGLPWELAKAFDGSAPVGEFISKSELSNLKSLSFSLQVNGELRQSGKTDEMIFNFDQIIAYVSQFITLKTGDLIFTGTPSGVAAVKAGDVLSAYLNDKLLLKFEVK